MMKSVIAIFDIGKTNKKLFCFDVDYQLVFEDAIHLPETQDEDGFPCEDLAALKTWALGSFNKIQNLEFKIEALNFSAYGASFVHLDRSGQPSTPLYNYLKPFPDALKEKFYKAYGTEQSIAQITASPDLGNLNSGMQLYGLKYARPGIFNAIAVSLHLPQYISSLFTGQYFSDITSIGCHTRLWDFEKGKYHEWVEREKIDQLLPPAAPTNSVVTASSNGSDFLCGIGLHDSSAALIPYLQNFSEPFILLSTGTWCITLNPFNHTPLTRSELQQDCLCYLSYQGKRVKASRLFSGHEHEVQVKRLAGHFHKDTHYFSQIEFDASLLEGDGFLLDDLSYYHSYEQAYHHLIQNLVQKQLVSTNLVLGNQTVKRLFVDGGFSQNPVFMNLLSKTFPAMEVYAASMAQASALGAALAIHQHWNGKPISENLIGLKFYRHLMSV